MSEHLRHLAESVGFLAAVVEVQRHGIHLDILLHIAIVHASVCGGQHTVQATHHVALHLDVDDTSGATGVVLGRRVADNLDFLNHVAVCTVQHRLELVSAEVRRSSVHIYLNALAIDGDVAVSVDAHARCPTQDVVAVAACSQRRLTHVHHQFVHLLLDKRALGLDFHFLEALSLFLQHEIRPAKGRLIPHERSLYYVRARGYI